MEATATPENGSTESDAIVVNNVTTLGTNPTTPVASRASIQDPTLESTTPQASASLIPPTPPSPGNVMLFREWSETPNLPPLQASRGVSSPMPPLADSVLITREESSTSPATTVNAVAIVANVANLATNIVRTVSESVMQRSQICSEVPVSSRPAIEASITATATDVCENNFVNNNTSGVHISNESIPLIPVAPSQAAVSNVDASDNGRNIMADLEDEHQESYVIDGQIITLYGSSSMRDFSHEDPNFTQENDRQVSKSSRVQRGVRKIKKLRKFFPGGRNTKGESSRRKRQDSPTRHEPSINGLNEAGGGGQSLVLEARKNRPRGDTVSDGDYESGDGESLIEAPNAHHFNSYAAIHNNNNNAHDVGNSVGARRSWYSEEFSGPTSNIGVNSSSSSTNQGNKKRIHGLARWLRGTTSESFSSNRSMTSSHSPGPGSRRKSHKSPPSLSKSSIQKLARNIRGAESNSNAGKKGLPPKPSSMTGKPAALDPQHLSQGFMPPLREVSTELSLNSLSRPSQPSLMANSLFHGQQAHSDYTGRQSLDPPIPAGPNDFAARASLAGPNDFAARASLVENADMISSESGHLPIEAHYVEDLFDEYDKYGSVKKKHDKPQDSCIDVLLQKAGEIAEMAASTQDEDVPLKLPPSPKKSTIKKGKSDGESVPLSMANLDDQIVHNDYLKLILVGDNAVDKSGLGRSLRKKPRRKKRREVKNLEVNVHTWTPSNADLHFRMWEVIASNSQDKYLPNYGARPGTQSLFFSDQSLYLLVYDLGASNPATTRHSNKTQESDSESECSDDEWNESYSAYQIEELNRKADRALQADIKERVLSWVNCIATRMTHSAILPIALKPTDMTPEEAIRRCNVMQTMILAYVEKLPSNVARPKILRGPETVVCVSLDDNMGMEYLEQMILEIADPSHKVFHHVGRPIPPGTVEILKLCERLKKEETFLVPVDHLLAKLPKRPEFSVDAVMGVLCFLANIGKVLYFGRSDPILKHYVILDRNWLITALHCFLQNNLEQELSETRDLIKLENFYIDQHDFPESQVTKTFSGNNSSCPILSSQDAQMLWKRHEFLMGAVQKSSHLSEKLTTTSTMFDFLQHLLEQRDVFLPLDIDRYHSAEKIFFVPSLLPKASSRDVWTYKTSEAWKVTLCHSWLFRDGAPAGVMERVTVALLRDLYESSYANAEAPTRQIYSSLSDHHLQRTNTWNLGLPPIASNDTEPIGPIKIHHIICWENSLLLKIGRVFSGGNESIIEIFVAVTDQVSSHSVASDVMRSNMQRLVVSGKGEADCHGQKLWKAGYNIVLDSIKASVAHFTNVERQVVCPECLAEREACSANTWSWDSILAAPDPTVRCMMGHKVKRHLICGTTPMITRPDDLGERENGDRKSVKDILPSVVLVGLWNKETKTIESVGSGFVANKKLGLVVTASHTLFKMDEGSDFGRAYKGLHNASVIIGVIPSDGANNTNAVFRYFAKIVAHDVRNMDACILKITSRLENDVLDHSLAGEQPERNIENLQEESLSHLKLTKNYEIEQEVRIIGFNQGGEGRLEQGKHVNTTSDFAKGYICRQFKHIDDESTSSDDSSSSEEGKLSPREEIVVECRTIVGHSGGPCVNNDGKVIGILSRSDPSGQRCYLVPSSEIKTLISRAKNSIGIGY